MSTAVTVAPPTSETIASITQSESAPPMKPPAKRKRVVKDEDEEEFDETRSVDSEDAGSLVDFIVKDNDDDANDDDNESVESEGPRNEEEARQRDLDGIDTSNIITGRRTRRQTVFYEQTVFNSDEYRKMMLDDVPDEEMHALDESEGEDDESDEEDGSYREEGSDGEEEEDESDDDSHPPPTPAKAKSPSRTPSAK